MSEDTPEAIPPKSIGRQIGTSANSSVSFLDELQILVRNVAGETKREMSMRTDGRKEGNVDIDRTETEERIRISGRILEPLDRDTKTADENQFASSLATALSKTMGIPIYALPKPKEDGLFPDIWLQTPEEKIGVEVTHLDQTTIEVLNTAQQYSSETTTEQIARAAIVAIQHKQKIDPAEAAKTYLLLISPYPIREAMQPPIQQHIAAVGPTNRYKETWIASLHEPPFQVQ